MSRALIIAGLAAAALGPAIRVITPDARVIDPETREVDQAKRDAQERARVQARRAYWSLVEAGNAAKADSAINRRTGKPHEHSRAKARRLRIAAKG